MIRELGTNDSHLILAMKNKAISLNIKAYLKAYGFDYPFVRFFGDEQGEIIICQKDDKTYVYLENLDKILLVCEFARTISTVVISDIPLPQLNDWYDCKGNEYRLDNPQKHLLDGISNEISVAHPILSTVFPNAVNKDTYASWYTDLSHRIRHNVSTIYTLEGKCSATVYENDNGDLLISQLGTLSEHRGKGLAVQIISHIADIQDANSIIVYSQDETSDPFYEKNGYKKTGEWYCYDREQIQHSPKATGTSDTN